MRNPCNIKQNILTFDNLKQNENETQLNSSLKNNESKIEVDHGG